MSNNRYGLEEKELEKLNIRLLYITQARYGMDWHSASHTHHFTELFYVLSGSGSFIIEGKSVPVNEDDLVIVNPNVSHTETGRSDCPLEYIVLGINGLQFQDGSQHFCFDYSIHNLRRNREDIRFYLHSLLREVREKETHFELVCQNLLEILILLLVRSTQKDLLIAPSRKNTRECRFIEQYIDEHFSENISLQTLSDLTYLNKYYLVHAFKKYKGTSPINYLIEKRLLESRHLLETTNYSVAKIASIIGFSSQSYFTQAFKKEAGISPNEYRKSLNQKQP